MNRFRALIAALFGAAAVVWAAWFWTAREAGRDVPLDAPGALRVTFLDVGYGDAAWVATPGGRHFLVDAGPGFQGRLRDYGQQIVYSRENARLALAAVLQRQGVRRLDAVFISHAHYDHWGGLKELLSSSRVSVGKVYESEWAETDAAYSEFRKFLKARGVPVKLLAAGETADVGDPAVAVRVLGPRKEYAGSGSDLANRSLVLHVRYGGVSVLFPGDAETEAEFDLLEAGNAASATVLKVSTHGSQRVSDTPFLDAVRPAAAVVSVATPNPFGNPHDETLQRFIDRGIDYYRTDLQGHVTMVSDGKNWSIYTER